MLESGNVTGDSEALSLLLINAAICYSECLYYIPKAPEVSVLVATFFVHGGVAPPCRVLPAMRLAMSMSMSMSYE